MDHVLSLSRVASATAWARPVRIAFLVGETDAASQIVDHIARYCTLLWGGRFNPIVPSTNDRIDDGWWEFLVNSDPDYVYSYIELSGCLKAEIRHKLGPLEIVEHKKQGSGPWAYRVAGTRSFTEASAFPQMIWNTALHKPSFVKISEAFPAAQDPLRSFVVRNLGCLPETTSTESWFGEIPRQDLDALTTPATDILSFVREMRGMPLLPIDLCQIYTPRVSTAKWSEVPTVVIGDTVADAAYAWNRGAEARPSLSALWLPARAIEEDAFLTEVGHLIGRSAWNGQQPGEVISFSLDPRAIKAVSDRLTSVMGIPMIPKRFEKFECPRFRDPGPYVQYVQGYAARSPVVDDRCLVSIPRLPFAPPNGFIGTYMLDIGFERVGHRSVSGHDVWTLPRRPMVTQCFSPSRPARVTLDGRLSTLIEGLSPNLELSIPGDSRVLHACLRGDTADVSSRRFVEFCSSDKGRFLEGTVALFGDLFQSHEYFTDPYWRLILDKAAGLRGSRAVSRDEAFKAAIDDYLQANPAMDSVSLAQWLTQRMPMKSSKARAIRHRDLISEFGILKRGTERFADDAADDLVHLVEGKVLLQGVDVRCPRCNLTTWYSVDDLSSEVRCPGCRAVFPFPANPEWSYRLNSLVRDSLAEHGIVPVIETLYSIAHMSLDATFMASVEAFESAEAKSPFSDLDVVGVVGGQVVLGEVKSSPASLVRDGLDRFADICLSVRPDLIVVAVDAAIWPDDVRRALDEFQGKMALSSLRAVDVLLGDPKTLGTVSAHLNNRRTRPYHMPN